MNTKYFSAEELLNASKTIYQAQFRSEEATFASARDIYDNLRYVLGPHYWGYDYSWESVCYD